MHMSENRPTEIPRSQGPGVLLSQLMDAPSAENCSWEEDGGVKNVNGDFGRQGNRLQL